MATLRSDERGLIPAIAQDYKTGQVLMLGYMNGESLQRTLADGEVWFYSRSRQELWHKGATSGSLLKLKHIVADCDGDALLLQVEPTGPVCHTGNVSCFFEGLKDTQIDITTEEGWGILEELSRVIQERKRSMPAGSYVASLLKDGVDRVAKKVIEEAGEAALAAKGGDISHTAREVADLWFHSLALLAALDIPPQAVLSELQRRRK